MLRTLRFALLLLALPALAVHAEAPKAQPYPAASTVDLLKLLAPPPSAEATQKELAEMLTLQKLRSADEAAYCKADQSISVFRFQDVLGPDFTESKLPKTAAFFSRVLATSYVPVDKAKNFWGRPRPSVADPEILPCVDVPKSPAYPSGHSTAGNLMAIVLSQMLPERAAELHARGRLFGFHRVLGGVHYPSDVAGGEICAAVVAQALAADPEYHADLKAATEELRAVLKADPDKR